MDTIKTEISLLDLQGQKNSLEGKLKALKANSKDYDKALYESQLKSVNAQIEKWGTKENIQYRIM